MAKMHYEFYTTLGCHLCDEAEALYKAVIPNSHIKTIEISASDILMVQYGTRIPVLKRLDSAQELGWPFDANTLLNFIQ